jgi:hypothetical protein
MTRLAVAVACWFVLTVWGWIELGFSGLVPLSTGLTVGIVCAVAIASGAQGRSLFRLLFQLYAGVNVLNIQIENVLFGTSAPGEIARTTATGLLAAAGVSAALAWASTRDAPDRWWNVHGTLAGNLRWKLPALGLLYIVLFLTAGSLIFPYIREFYARNPVIVMPSFGILLLIEFTRGLVHALSLLPFLRTMSGRRAQAAVLAGFALAILGGISALLLPIEVLPPEIRRVHIVEIFGSNFLFGISAAYWLVRRRVSDVAANACQSSGEASEGPPRSALLDLPPRARS